MSTLAIATSALTKSYGGVRVVDGVELKVPEGTVYGFLGPNGAGKSTTMKMVLGLARPTAGEVEVLGERGWIGGAGSRSSRTWARLSRTPAATST